MIHINDRVWVKLTEPGWVIFEMHKMRLGTDSVAELADQRTAVGDGEEWQHFQLWVLMQIFGPSIYMAAPPFFENNEIRLEKP